MTNLGVVAGGHGVTAHLQRLIQQVTQLDFLVADDTGIGGLAALVAGGEVVHDLLAEVLLEIENLMGKAQKVGHMACVPNAILSSAGSEEGHGETQQAVPLGL